MKYLYSFLLVWNVFIVVSAAFRHQQLQTELGALGATILLCAVIITAGEKSK